MKETHEAKAEREPNETFVARAERLKAEAEALRSEGKDRAAHVLYALASAARRLMWTD